MSDQSDRVNAKVFVVKLAAAERQLNAAIRMAFADEDALAITTVAAAAYQLLRDIYKSRGHNLLQEQQRDAVLGTALAYLREELSEEELRLLSQSDLWKEVITVAAEQIKALGLGKKRLSEVRHLLEVHAPPKVASRYWAQTNKAAN